MGLEGGCNRWIGTLYEKCSKFSELGLKMNTELAVFFHNTKNKCVDR